MQVTYIGLSEYFKKCISRAKQKKYVVILSLVARYADAKEAYDKLEKDWASLNDLTHDKVLIVFSLPKVQEKASFFYTPGKPNYEGVMCPFVELLSGNGIEDNNGPFDIYHDSRNVDWKQRHSQTITQFARDYNIPTERIPCLFIYDLKTDKQKIVPIYNDTDIYATLKAIIDKINEYGERQNQIENELEKYTQIEAYYNLYTRLENISNSEDSKQNIAIRKVLRSEKSFMEMKADIADSRIRRDLKRLGQWKRHYIEPFESDKENVQAYYMIKERQINNLEAYEKIWDDLEVKSIKGKIKTEDKVLHDLLNACICMQEDAKYFNESENGRNDNIRNLLKMAKYDVKDQTRRGISPSGIDAGEIDILIEEDQHTVTIIEALNLTCIDTQKLDNHIDKIYDYDTVGNMFNIILVYVTTKDFVDFCKRYYAHIKGHKYKYPLISVEEKYEVNTFSYSDIRIMKAIHNRNGREVVLYHICMLFDKNKGCDNA